MAAGIVGSVVVQEALSRGVSYLLAKREERASIGDTFERLDWAHSEMEFVLERSSKLPITDMSLLGQRRSIKRAYHECDELWRSKRRVLNDDQETEQGVITRTQSSSSFPVVKKITLAAVRSASSFLGMNKDGLTRSAVRRFELLADKAGKFMRDLESGCSLAHYRFFNPLITQLLQGNTLWYNMVLASQTHRLCICPMRSEDYGVVAELISHSYDAEILEKSFYISLVLRLSENTDIVGVAIQCLQSLGPQFKSLAQVTIGELSQLPTKVLSNYHPDEIDYHMATSSDLTISTLCSAMPDPFCCEGNVQRACANNVIPPELSYRFPGRVLNMAFSCHFSAFDQYNMQRSADEVETNIVHGWPLLKLSALFGPHKGHSSRGIFAVQIIGEQKEDMNGVSLEQIGEMVLTNAVTWFLRRPELTEYCLRWISPHGSGTFLVEKPKEKVHQNMNW